MYTVYSKYGCPYCDKVKTILQLAELKHVVYDLGVDYTREEFYVKFGNGSTFPQVVLNDGADDSVKLGGCTETVAYLKEQKLV
jgi:glutaredoxin